MSELGIIFALLTIALAIDQHRYASGITALLIWGSIVAALYFGIRGV